MHCKAEAPHPWGVHQADSEISHVARHSFSSNIHTNTSINNSEVTAALSLQKGLLTGQNRNGYENEIHLKGSVIL